MTVDASDAGTPRWLDWVPIDEVQFAERNPKQHDLVGIGASFDEHGVVEVPALDERTGRLVAGHGRIERMRQARAEGQSPPDGVVVGDDGVWRAGILRGWRSHSDAQAASYLVGSNQLTTKGGWDEAALAPYLREIEAADASLLAATGFSTHDVAAIEAALATASPPDLEDLARGAAGGGIGELWPRIAGFKAPPPVVTAWLALVEAHEGKEWAALADLLGITVEPDAHLYDPGAADPDALEAFAEEASG